MKSRPEIGRSAIFWVSMTWLTSDFCVSTPCSRLLNFDILLHRLDAERYRNRGILSYRQGERALIGAELAGLHRQLVFARRQARDDRDSSHGREISSLSVGFQIPQSDSRLRDHASRRVGNRNVQSGQLLCGKLDGKQQGRSEKSPLTREKDLVFTCAPARSGVRWLCQETDFSGIRHSVF